MQPRIYLKGNIFVMSLTNKDDRAAKYFFSKNE